MTAKKNEPTLGEAVNAETGEATPAGGPLPPLAEDAYPEDAADLPQVIHTVDRPGGLVAIYERAADGTVTRSVARRDELEFVEDDEADA